MIHLGLTGGIGCGKSTVAKMLKARGAVLIDADAIVKEILRKGGPGYMAVVKAFGRDILSKSGSIVRKRLAAVVFDDRTARKALELMLHPLVIAKRRERINKLKSRKNPPALVVSESALIFEAGTMKEFDKVALVTAPEETRVRRLKAGGWREEEIRERMRAQFTEKRKAALADLVIDNGGTPESTEKQVERLYRALTKGE